MKIMHLSDLHLGKRVNEFSMMEDQRTILNEILQIIDEEKPDVVLIAGDVYDRSQPSTEVVSLLDDFLNRLHKRKNEFGLDTCIISGNHDSAERLAFGSKLMEKSGIHISPVYDGNIMVFTKDDAYGRVNFYLLPFIRPADVRRFFPDEDIASFDDAVSVAIRHACRDMDQNARNVMVSHQFVTGARLSDSEDIVVGTLDNIGASVYDGFDYVALGHIHREQAVGKETIRYAGTPLKYSLSEIGQEKYVTMVELGEKGSSAEIKSIPLHPLHDMRQIEGRYDDLMKKENYEGTATHDYLKVILTDEDELPHAIDRLRVVYPNIMHLEYNNPRTRHKAEIVGAEHVEEKKPMELVEEFYEQQNNQPLSEEQRDYLTKLIEKIWEEEV